MHSLAGHALPIFPLPRIDVHVSGASDSTTYILGQHDTEFMVEHFSFLIKYGHGYEECRSQGEISLVDRQGDLW